MATERTETASYRLGEFVVDPERRVIRRGDNDEVHVEPKVMGVLQLLVERAGRVVSREEFFDTVWPNAAIGDEVLSRCVYQLRSHFDDSSREQRFIATVPKRGYQLVVQPEPLEPTADATALGSSRPRWPVLIAAVGVAIAAVILVAFLPGEPDLSNGFASAPSVLPATDPPAIVVIPYADLSENGDRGYLSEGITDELLHGLGQIRGLRIIGRESAQQLVDATPAQVRARLDVDVILTGSVRFNGDDVRINNRLVDTATGDQLWSASFDGKQADIFAIEDQIARAIVQELEIQLKDDGSTVEVRRSTDNQQARRLYLEGRYYLKRRSAGALAEAADYFQQAIDADPDFALAYSGLADATMLLSQYGGKPLDEATAVAEVAIANALGLDPSLAEAHASKGLVLLQNWRLDEAGEVLRTAAAYDPSYVAAHLWLGRTLDLGQDYTKALAVYQRAYLLDPLSPLLNLNVGRMLTHMGRNADGRVYLERILELDPEFANAYWALGYNAMVAGELETAKTYYEQAIAKGLTYHPQIYGHLAQLHIDRGEYDAAEKWLVESERVGPRSYYAVRVRNLLRLAQGDVEELPEWFLSMYEAEPETHIFLLRAAAAESWLGNHERAVELYERGLKLTADETLYYVWDYGWGNLLATDVAHAYGQTGRFDRQRELLDKIGQFFVEADARGMAIPSSHYARATWHALRGEDDIAMQQLETAKERGWTGYWIANIDPKLERLRAQPAFAASFTGLTDAP